MPFLSLSIHTKAIIVTNFDDVFEIDCRMCTESKYICLQHYGFLCVCVFVSGFSIIVVVIVPQREDIYNWQRFYDTRFSLFSLVLSILHPKNVAGGFLKEIKIEI